MKILSLNKKAKFNYELLEHFEAGVELTGTEVKSILRGNVNLDQSFIIIRKGELWLLNCHISPYNHGNIFNKDPLRNKKLLMHKREILKLSLQMQQLKCHLIPIKFYLKRNKIKLDFAISRAKKLHNKKEEIKKRDIERQIRYKY